MKLSISTVIIPCLLSITASAWELTINMADGRHVTSHGTLNSDCVTYDFDMSSPVNRAIFTESTFADTFELYEQANCGGRVSYRENGGNHVVTPARIIRSYKVY